MALIPVLLRLAYAWDCPQCGRTQTEPIIDLLKYEPPTRVQCTACEADYQANAYKKPDRKGKASSTGRSVEPPEHYRHSRAG